MNLAADGTETYVQPCSACHRTFNGSGAYQNHLRSCQSAKKRRSWTLAAAKEVIARKRQRKAGDSASGSTTVPGLSGNAINVRYS